MPSWSASADLDSAMLFAVALRGIYPATSNPASIFSWVAISPVISARFRRRSRISWRFALVSQGRYPAVIQYFRDVGYCQSPKRALAAIFAAWLPRPPAASGAVSPGSSPGPVTPSPPVAWPDNTASSSTPAPGLACSLAGPGVPRRCEDLPPRKHVERRAPSGHALLLPARDYSPCAWPQSRAQRHRQAPRHAHSSRR